MREKFKLNKNFIKKKTVSKVTVELWSSSFEKSTYDFIKEFSPYHAHLGDLVEFIPRFALWFCVFCKSTNFTVDNSMCVSGGRYCAPNSSNKK